MASIFFVVFLLPAARAISAVDLIIFSKDVQECIFATQLEALEACPISTFASNEGEEGYMDLDREESKCIFHQANIKGKVCLKPALLRLLSNPDDPVLNDKSVQDVFLCVLDLGFDKFETCSYVTTKDWMKKNRIHEDESITLTIGVMGCVFEKIGFVFQECLTIQHKNARAEL